MSLWDALLGIACLVCCAWAVNLDDLGYHWVPMTEEDLHKHYSSYERCVLSLDDLSYDYKSTIFAQPKCVHLLQDTSKYMKDISTRCWLGGKQQRQDNGICVGMKGGSKGVTKDRKGQTCFALSDRPSIWKHWKGLNSSVSPAVDLLNTFVELDYDLVLFIGDSMANQLGQRLLCTVMRNHIPVLEFGSFFSMPVTGASAKVYQIPQPKRAGGSKPAAWREGRFTKERQVEVTLSSYRLLNGLGVSTLHERQKGSIPGVSKACTVASSARSDEDGATERKASPLNATCVRERQSQYIYEQTRQGFRLGPKWQHSLHLLVLPIRLKFPWEYTPFARALYEVGAAMQAEGSQLVVLSPFAQHFPRHPHGLYENFTKLTEDEEWALFTPPRLPCRPHAESSPTENYLHPDLMHLQQALDRLDTVHQATNTLLRPWREVIFVFDLFPYSVPMFDLHCEGHATGWSVDCTHYFFQPTMFDVMWTALSHALRSQHTKESVVPPKRP